MGEFMTSAAGVRSTGRRLAALDVIIIRQIRLLAARPVQAAFVLIVLVLALDLAGNFLLPPLDRTEVIYAQTAKQMLEADGPGTWTAPAFQSEAKFEKPLAVLWLQGVSAWATGQSDQIRGYRVPSIMGTILAVLFTYWGARKILPSSVAFVGAALLATMLVVTVQATLAMPESLMMATTSAALFALGRSYAARDSDMHQSRNALVFWIALGASVLVNVATVPLIALLTVLALLIWDRGRADWLKRLWSLPGFTIFFVLAAVWPCVLWMGGTLDAAVQQWRDEGLHLLLGPQEMKWRVLPGLFVVFLLLGIFPAGLFLGPAVQSAWRERATPAIRFLVAWAAPYLIFLELFTRKTPLYMVQAMLPPLAVLFAVWVVREPLRAQSTFIPADEGIHERRWFRFGTLGWMALVVGLVAAMWVLPFLLELWVSPIAVVLGLIAITLAVIATKALLRDQRFTAAASLVAMTIAFNNLAIPVTFAGLRPVWVATELRSAIGPLKMCGGGDVVITGYSEPSSVFELGTNTVRLANGKEVAQAFKASPSIAVLSSSQKANFEAELGKRNLPVCVAAYDFIKSCSHRFEITTGASSADGANCLPEAKRFRCDHVLKSPLIGRMCK